MLVIPRDVVLPFGLTISWTTSKGMPTSQQQNQQNGMVAGIRPGHWRLTELVVSCVCGWSLGKMTSCRPGFRTSRSKLRGIFEYTFGKQSKGLLLFHCHVNGWSLQKKNSSRKKSAIASHLPTFWRHRWPDVESQPRESEKYAKE